MPNAAALRRKLHAWELQHLREHVEDLRQQLDEMTRRAEYAEDLAESWRDDALRMAEGSPGGVGLTQDGHLVALHQ